MASRLRYGHASRARALPAAAAAEAATAVGAFLPMYDSIFEHHDALEDADPLAHAIQLSLDPEAFVAALAAPAVPDRIRRDLSSGMRSGVNGAPTFFITSQRHEDPDDITSLLSALESAVTRQAFWDNTNAGRVCTRTAFQ